MLPKKVIQVRRPTGNRVDGEWEEGTPVAQPDIKGSIQVITQRELQSLPEGRRTHQSFVIYTQALLNTALEGVGQPDQVLLYNEWYEVYSRGKWLNMVRSHKRYICQRITDK